MYGYTYVQTLFIYYITKLPVQSQQLVDHYISRTSHARASMLRAQETSNNLVGEATLGL